MASLVRVHGHGGTLNDASRCCSGISATRIEQFDTSGHLIWLQDERGYLTHHQYDAALGQVTRTIQDVDDARLSVPSGWATPSDGGLHLTTDYWYDEQGRQTQVLGPAHDVDAARVRTASWSKTRRTM